MSCFAFARYFAATPWSRTSTTSCGGMSTRKSRSIFDLVLLASLGIYGVLAFLVGQRTREIGLRMALGASHSDVLTIFSRGVALAAIGIAAGVLFSAAAVSMIAGVLYGVRPRDPIVFATVPVLLLTFAALASYLPARRATTIDPMRALRES
jgi:putative ABC transport system permease protein